MSKINYIESVKMLFYLSMYLILARLRTILKLASSILRLIVLSYNYICVKLIHTMKMKRKT